MSAPSTTGATEDVRAEPARPVSAKEERYDIKRIDFLGKTRVPILMQSRNGPCPLLAIANQMLLSNRLALNDQQEDIGLSALVERIAEKMIDENPILDSDPNAENRRKAVADAIDTLPLLSQGLDVNVKFSGVADFEFDKSIAVFDILQINLYHGWVIDPLDETYAPLRSLSYNTLVERVVQYDAKFGGDDHVLAAAMSDPALRQIAADGQLAQQFLHTHPSQLTYAGLAGLHDTVKERELCAFFRNNHFSTMFRHEGHLYLLCTDSGFKTRTAVAWERLTDINGDTELCSPAFGDPNAFLSAEEALADMSADAQLAQQLQLEEDMNTRARQAYAAAQTNRAAQPQHVNSGGQAPLVVAQPVGGQPLSQDEMLARQLQEEENRQAQLRVQGGTAAPRPHSRPVEAPVRPAVPMSPDELLARQLQAEEDEQSRRQGPKNDKESKANQSSMCTIM